MKNRIYLLPYIEEEQYIVNLPKNCILYNRYKNDFQENCLIYKNSHQNNFNASNIHILKKKGFKLCYTYEMFDFENKEFTIEGYKSIISDIQQVVEDGFDYIMVSNPFIIEILCNEFSDLIKIIISSNLEINNVRGKLFFDVLNNISSISYIVLSQNQLTIEKIQEIKNKFDTHIDFIVEIDRFASNIQVIHEHYYNIIYGYYSIEAIKYISNFLITHMEYIKKNEELFYSLPYLSYKIGEMNIDFTIILNNLIKCHFTQ